MPGRGLKPFLFAALAGLASCGGTPDEPDGGATPSCTSSSQCDDGIFCNGGETCAPGSPGASPLGCRASEPPCMPSQTCDEDADRCISICGARTDADGDGVDATECGGDDCDDADRTRYPGALEACNERDDDCDEDVDEGDACSDGGVDAGSDAGADASVDGGTDAGAPTPPAQMCEACSDHADCMPGAFCVNLTAGGRACVPGCDADIPTCPRTFSCVLDIGSGVDTTVCLPIGGTCCVDEDRDTYGTGIGCPGPDCDDAESAVNPAARELCNGFDDDCNELVDESPTQCETGFCRPSGSGYELVTGGACAAGGCGGGAAASCGGYRCEGDASGAMCFSSCHGGGSDDDGLCAADHHCDTGACIPDEVNGGACNEDSDCQVGRCDNGFCCASGACCAVASDCPGGAGASYTCDDSAGCQGTLRESTCEASRCVTTTIPDDRGCLPTTVSLLCGLYLPVYCDGETDQSPSFCPSSCGGDADCLLAAHCEVTFCVPDRPIGSSCSQGTDCQSGMCADSRCCTAACDGPCVACNVPGSTGTCVAVPGCVP